MTNQTSDLRLRTDIREMGRILGEVIRDQWGDNFFDLVEETRTTTRALRINPDSAVFERFMQRLEAAPLDDIVRLVRSFTIYFHIANTAEQHYRISPEFSTGSGDIRVVLKRARDAALTRKRCATSSASCTSARSSQRTRRRQHAARSSRSCRRSRRA